MKRTAWLLGAPAFAGILAPAPPAIAADYLSAEAAQRQFFPQAERFEELTLSLTPQQRQAIATLAGAQPSHGRIQVWRAMRDGKPVGHVFVDEVIGRQDFITYAVAIDSTGKLSPVEILTYRESHGGEVRNKAWRKQFAGRDSMAQLQFARDIKNIAGATLSSEHVTQGVRWLLALWQTSLKQ